METLRASSGQAGRVGGDAPVSVLIVDDHEALLKATALLLRQEGLEIAGTARNAEEAIELVQRRLPDVALIDINLPGESGLELTERIAEAEGQRTAVLLYTGVEDREMLLEALRCGASGVACKTGGAKELIGGIRTVAAGGIYTDPRLPRLTADAPPETPGILSPRERQVLTLTATGAPQEEIAGHLVISPETARTHLRNAIRKLGARNRPHAIAIALSRGEIDLAEIDGLRPADQPRSTLGGPRSGGERPASLSG
jgi:DNA-binding NarL/FixJ family response regulator